MKTYSPKKAWQLATVYFASCLIVSWQFGILQALTRAPIASSEQLGDALWWTATIGVTAFVVFAYGYLWPRGTLHHDRPLHLPQVLVFGLLWGGCQGQLVLVIYRGIESFGFSNPMNIGLMFLVYSVLTALWHSRFWDVYVSPDHNIFEWNVRKVLFAHVPFLIFALMHLALYNNAAIFVMWQALALTLSTFFMRFPAPGDPETPAHDGQGIRLADI